MINFINFTSGHIIFLFLFIFKVLNNQDITLCWQQIVSNISEDIFQIFDLAQPLKQIWLKSPRKNISPKHVCCIFSFFCLLILYGRAAIMYIILGVKEYFNEEN